ncbi:heat shock protein, Hsp20 family [Legionella sainthelensi]|uniref:Heat shock protein, Hsp20 family n=1 Tax=Legionella sainthelensi TaxID=28087 RepID=A0A0W0YMG7_9GAMM|nr:Hsp20/alpha crystallin family protein [Legionella sainthelensi]KTD58121.1 heat shock protein, Hsp20 family [Legionella sainthelensi]VEH33935.1 heat shock protein, Hsp20 family [Legionella sainthelensi]
MSNLVRRTYFPTYNVVGSLLDQFFNTVQGEHDTSFIETSSWAPSVDLKEESARFLVIADLPGVKKEDMDISLENHVLTIKGKRDIEKTENQKHYTRRERVQGQFYRRFYLPETADDKQISARYTNGVLEIIIPKKENETPKKIDISVAE